MALYSACQYIISLALAAILAYTSALGVSNDEIYTEERLSGLRTEISERS